LNSSPYGLWQAGILAQNIEAPHGIRLTTARLVTVGYAFKSEYRDQNAQESAKIKHSVFLKGLGQPDVVLVETFSVTVSFTRLEDFTVRQES